MTTSSPLPVARASDSSDRNPAIAAVRGTPARQGRPPVGRSGGFAKRFFSALMRSLAAPHI
jgi:hypothetical protein